MKNIQKARIFLVCAILALTAVLYGCSNKETSAQTRSDLTSEHVRGLYADMKRSDVEDLLGKSDSALAEKESFEMYSLADGTVAVLRYAGDKLQSAFIRGKDNIEEVLFNNYGSHSNQINDGTTNSDGKEITDSADNGTENQETSGAFGTPDSSAAPNDTSVPNDTDTSANMTGQSTNTAETTPAQ